MIKVKLESYKIHLKEKSANEKFGIYYDIERAKVSLAQKISELRKRENLRQLDLAKKMRVSQQFVSQIETAEEKNLTLETLLKIAKALGRELKISFPKISTQTPPLKIV